MTRIAFDKIVEDLERKYKGRQVQLTRVAIAWAVMGYVVLLGSLACAIALVILAGSWIFLQPGIASIKLGGILVLTAGALVISILRSLWSQYHAPEGRELKRAEAPVLFDMIDSISDAAGGVKFHKVLLTDDLNAAVVQLPRAGILGFYRNYLILGLQLMDALGPEEFKAVIAHEFSHLSNKDGKVGNWIYRIRLSWEKVAVHLFSQSGLLTAPLRKFVQWFWPRFNARAFVLSRFNEYRADAFSAEVTSPAHSASALQRIDLRARHLAEVFWIDIDRRLTEEPEPPKGLYAEMREFLGLQPDQAMATRWLDQAFAVSTGTSDTHPSLSDRVRALGGSVDSRDLAPMSEHASEVLLGEELARDAREMFSREWHKNALENWKNAHADRVKRREELQELEAAPISDEKGEERDGRWRRISLRGETEGVEPLLPELRRFVEDYPDHLSAAFILGRYLLSKDDSAGLRLLEKVLEKDPDATLACFGEMAGYFDRQGNHEAVRSLKERADAHDLRMNLLDQARGNVSSTDTFKPHGLNEKNLAAIRKILEGEKSVRNAWLVQKHYREFPDFIQYILIMDMKFNWYAYTSEAEIAAILQRVADGVVLDRGVLVVRGQSSKPLLKRMQGSPDDLIYQKS